MFVLLQFLYRLAFGLALAMTWTSARQVTSGYFRVHSYVLLGLHVLAGLIVGSAGVNRWALWPTIGAAVLSYLSSACWLYERAFPGKILLGAVALATAAAGLLALPQAASQQVGLPFGPWADFFTSGLLLGITMAAMLLGHWYLNAPGMQLTPLKRLVAQMGGSVLLRAVVSGVGLAGLLAQGWPESSLASFLALRWLSGLVGALVLAVMTWETLKVPNTQSATGILYVGVIVTFLGELTSLLLSRQAGLLL